MANEIRSHDPGSDAPAALGRRHAYALLEDMCAAAAESHGAGRRSAASLARATLEAEARGRSGVGISHLFDYLDGLQSGRIAGRALPTLEHRTPVVLAADCHGGLAQDAFELYRDDLVEAALRNGMAVLSLRGCYTAGELGFYARHLSHHGLVALVAGNTPPLLAFTESKEAVLGTNPLAFSLPHLDGLGTVLVDQASSAAAYVTVRQYADSDVALPDHWALNDHGEETTDAKAALRGALLPFGGYKGGNIAYLVEIMATLSGAAWSLDASPFDEGGSSPNVGLFISALSPAAFDQHYLDRLREHLERLFALAPGARRLLDRVPQASVPVPDALFARLRQAARM